MLVYYRLYHWIAISLIGSDMVKVFMRNNIELTP